MAEENISEASEYSIHNNSIESEEAKALERLHNAYKANQNDITRLIITIQWAIISFIIFKNLENPSWNDSGNKNFLLIIYCISSASLFLEIIETLIAFHYLKSITNDDKIETAIFYYDIQESLITYRNVLFVISFILLTIQGILLF